MTATGCDTFCSGAPPGDTMPSECSPGDRERQHDTFITANLGQRWRGWWLAAWYAPSHYKNQS